MSDIFVLWLNASGLYQSAHCFGSTGNDFGLGVCSGSDGSLYTTGFFAGRSILTRVLG